MYDNDEPCGHHCDSDCPRCGEDRPKPRQKAPVKKTKPQKRMRRCSCEGYDHNHGCPNGM